MAEVPHLKLDLTEKGFVRFSRNQSVPDELWAQVVSWWTPSSSSLRKSPHFEVPPSTFLHRFRWLRTSWTSLGNSVDLTPSVRELVKQSKNDQANFDQLARATEEQHLIDFRNLGLKRAPTDAQVNNASLLCRMPNGANFSVPGAGKTMTQLMVWRYLQTKSAVGHLLVVCPKSAFEAWTDEPRRIFDAEIQVSSLGVGAIPTTTEVLLVNYEQLEKVAVRDRLSAWVEKNQAMVVLDEAHRVKGGSNSVRWQGCLSVCSVATRVDLLTGTPMPQSYDDLRNLFGLSWRNVSQQFLSEDRLRMLRRGGVFVRTTKQELQLPEPTIVEHEIEAGPIQAQIYSALTRTYRGLFNLSQRDEDYFGRRGRAVMTLLAAATNPGLLMGPAREDAFLGLRWPPESIRSDSELIGAVESYAAHEIPTKYEWVSRYLMKASESGRKVLVWSTFVGNLRALERVLQPHNPALVYGAVNSDDRRRQIDKFRNDPTCNVLLTNPQTLGEGISLHNECHDAIYIDRCYNAGLYLQSLDRIHRLGLAPDQETRIHLLMTENTIDQRVSSRLRTKISRLGNALDDPGLADVSLPDDEYVFDQAEILGLESNDLTDLLGHLGSDG